MPNAELARSADYREFLKIWLSRSKKKPNFAALSRKAGFSSRSFMKEVVEGKKRLTPQSLAKFVKAFALSGVEKRFFECLVAREETAFDWGFSGPLQIDQELEKARRRLMSKRTPGASESSFNNWGFKIHHVAEVYAALGSPEMGASLEEIQGRTSLPGKICEEVLHFLAKKGGATQRADRYFAETSSLDVFGLGEDESFRTYYREALWQLIRKSQVSLQSDHEFFFHSAFSIKKDSLPEFKRQLKTLILGFLDETQNDDGDKVAKLTLGMHL